MTTFFRSRVHFREFVATLVVQSSRTQNQSCGAL